MSGVRHRATTGKPNRIPAAHGGKGDSPVPHAASLRYGSGHVLAIVAFFLMLLYAVYIAGAHLPDPKDEEAPVSEFSAVRARRHLKALTSMGSRPSGSYESDVLAVDYLLGQAKLIAEKALPEYAIEYHAQTVSGSLAVARQRGFCITGAYSNINNVVVRIVPKGVVAPGSILVNAHFDTVPKTEGASDDAVSCAVMLEMLRALSRTSSALKHAVVMLFNGAEEGALLGSHAFVSQHSWMSDVKTVVNIEAAGSGSQEVVFQAGPENPWIIDTYAATAKYPFASVIAQEIFQADVIPSDTDFRIFREYGNLSGIDLAFAKNGYVYHTKFDDAKSIPDGSIQHAGDNILALLKGLSASPYLADPGDYRHGDAVFFDVLGVFMVAYPKRLQLLINVVTCVATLVYLFCATVLKRRFPNQDDSFLSDRASFSSMLMCTVVIVASWILSVLVAFFVSQLVVHLGLAMFWYSRPSLAVLVYGMPAVFGLILAHYIGNAAIRKCSSVSLRSFAYAHLLIYVTVTLVATRMSLASSFVLWLWVVFPLLLTCLPMDFLTMLPEAKHNGVFMLHILGWTVPCVLTVSQINVFFLFFIPLFGRSGHDFPSDHAVAVLLGLSAALVLSMLASLYHGGRNMKRFLSVLAIASCLPLLYVCVVGAHPYSLSDPVTPKRLEMQHTQRTFYYGNGTVRKQDSGLFLQPMDYLKMKYIEDVPFYKDVANLDCSGAYCGLPYYYAKRYIYRRLWFLHGEGLPSDKRPLTPAIYAKEVVAPGRWRFHFDVPGPPRMNLFLSPKDNVRLSDWSFYRQRKDESGTICSTSDFVGSSAHMVFYSRGYQDSRSWKFWIELQTESDAMEDLGEIGIARFYFSGEESQTAFLKRAISELPKFVCDQAWTSCYDSFLLAK